MGRINGVNSDFTRKNGVKLPSPELPAPTNILEMKLFICPQGQPNQLEADTGFCEGDNTTCPARNNVEASKTGHALIHFHQNEGLSLVTNNHNNLQLDQSGNINLNPAATGKAVISGNVDIKDGQLKLQDKNETAFLTVAVDNFSLNINGLKIEIDKTGNMKIKPSATGKVTIEGDLTVTGKINGK